MDIIQGTPSFCVNKVKFGGYEISSEAIRMHDENVGQIDKFARPKIIRQLRRKCRN